MSDTVLSLQQIENLFRILTLQVLGLDPTALDNQNRVRIGWPSKGAPAWKQNEDVIFLLINYDDDLITQQVETIYQDQDTDYASRTQSYTRVIRVNWIFYGPNSFNDADMIRSGWYLSEFKEQLDANNLALIVDIPMPVRSPELFNGQWWERTSFYARFNEKVVRQSSIPYIKYADVQIVKG